MELSSSVLLATNQHGRFVGGASSHSFKEGRWLVNPFAIALDAWQRYSSLSISPSKEKSSVEKVVHLLNQGLILQFGRETHTHHPLCFAISRPKNAVDSSTGEISPHYRSSLFSNVTASDERVCVKIWNRRHHESILRIKNLDDETESGKVTDSRNKNIPFLSLRPPSRKRAKDARRRKAHSQTKINLWLRFGCYPILFALMAVEYLQFCRFYMKL